MGNFSEVVGRLARMVGLKSTDARRTQQMQQQFSEVKASNVDRLEAIKEQIRQLEARALKKKKELDAARGDSKRLIAGEIERSFRDLDRLRGKEVILARNIEKISMAQAKLEEVSAARLQGVDESQLDDIALDAEEAFAEAKATDRAAVDLDKVKYTPPQSDPIDVEQRIAELGDEAPAVDKESGLSAAAQRRLKDLETTEE